MQDVPGPEDVVADVQGDELDEDEALEGVF